MQMPNVRRSLKDEANNVTYHVLAYRQLSRMEVLQSIAQYKQQSAVRRRKRPLKNGSVTIVTIHGATPGL